MGKTPMQIFLGILIAAGTSQPAGFAKTPPAGWQTYRSPDYGFMIDYPSEMTFFPGYPAQPPHRSMIPVCDTTSVACFLYNGHSLDETVIQSMGVSVNVLRDVETEADCTDIGDADVDTVVLHGTRFRSAKTGSAAAGSSEGGSVYDAFHQGVCFEITLGTAQTDIGREQYAEYGLHPVDQNALRAVRDEMSQMLQSFRFTSPGATGAAPSSFAAATSAVWHTYHSGDYGFKIDYPQDIAVSSSCMFQPVACFEYSGNAFDATVIQSLRVTVDILRDRKTEAECDDIDEGPVTTAVIHGTQFHFAQTWRGGMGKSEAIDDYRAFHQNVCYEIELITRRIDVGPLDYGDLGLHTYNQNAMRAVQHEMNRILQTFRFVGLVRYGAGWNVYLNSYCGGHFEYPADAPVEIITPVSRNWMPSSAFTCVRGFTERGRRYTVTEKGFLNQEQIDDWINASGLPGLAQAKQAANGSLEYKGPTLAYRVLQGQLAVFIVSDAGEPHPGRRDRVFEHLVKSFNW